MSIILIARKLPRQSSSPENSEKQHQRLLLLHSPIFLINESFQLVIFPHDWKLARVIPLHKKGPKPEYADNTTISFVDNNFNNLELELNEDLKNELNIEEFRTELR